MEAKRIFCIFSFFLSSSLFGQVSVYVSNTGIDNSDTPTEKTTPLKTLEGAYNFIFDHYNSNNVVTQAITIFLINDGGPVLVSEYQNTLLWEISGTESRPIIISSLDSRAALSRNLDELHMLYLERVNHMKIKYIDFVGVTSGAILIDDCDHTEITFCSFRGNKEKVTARSTGLIWLGVLKNYSGYQGASSSDNIISNNHFYGMGVSEEFNRHHALYISNGAHNNRFFNNYINFPPAYGIHGGHGDYSGNFFTRNLISRKERSNNNWITGIVLSSQNDLDYGKSYDNGAPHSVFGNFCYNNYVYDSENKGDGVKIVPELEKTNYISDNHKFSGLFPNDPYWLGYSPEKVSNRMVSGDFDRDGFEDDLAAFYDYGRQTIIHVWESHEKANAFEYSSSRGWWKGDSYSAQRISNRIVSGDFDQDGFKNDIAAFYDYGNGLAQIHVWSSDGSGFGSPEVWWSSTGYDVNRISGTLVSGDFDRDGFEDDLAAFFENGDEGSIIHVWLSKLDYRKKTQGFHYQGSTGWWMNPSYQVARIKGRVVSGDFNEDGLKNEILAFYDRGNNKMEIHLWTSTGSSIVFSDHTWWEAHGYSADKVSSRIVSGDFDGDNIEDDILVFYDYGNGEARIHTWISSGSSMQYSKSSGRWVGKNYSLKNINGRVLSGDFDRNGKVDGLCSFYDYSDSFGSLRSHVWHRMGKDFIFVNESLGYPWLTPFSYQEENGAEQKYQINPSKVMGQGSVSVYPIPARDLVIFESPEPRFQIKVFDVQGKLLLDEFVNDGTFQMDTGNLYKGIFWYLISQGNESYRGKFVKY